MRSHRPYDLAVSGHDPHALATKQVCVYMNISLSELVPRWWNCRQEQVTDLLLLRCEYLWCEIYHLAMVYIDISDRWNHQYLCNFYVLIFKKVKDQWIKYSPTSVIILCSGLKSLSSKTEGNFTWMVMFKGDSFLQGFLCVCSQHCRCCVST